MAVGGNFTSCQCGPDTTACDNPTQPVATVGLCLADGSPIAVTVVRDCAGTVTSEGWVDLTTGAWSVGAPPAGTIACGDSRSITTNGTFCDVDDDGAVLGLVLVEYQYAADGSIAAVRLVDAVTGETYTPAGTITTCPAGVAQPERDLLQLCDTAPDGAVTVFLRDYARSEVGQITGHTDYALDGTPYTPAGAVGACPDCPTSYATECWSFVQAQVSYDNTTGGDCGVIEPRSMGQCAGTWVISSWVIDGVERVTSPVTFQATGCGGTPAQFHGAWAATLSTIDPTSTWEAAYNGTCLFYIRTTGVDPDTEYGQMTMYLGTAPDTVYTLSPAASRSETQYTKVYRQECDGSTSVTWLDAEGAELPEQPEGDLTPCGGTAPVQDCASAVTVLRLCDLNPDAPPDDQGKRCAIPFLRHLVYDCTGALVETRDTTPDGTTPYTPVEAVDCGSGGVPAMVEVPWEVVGIEPDPASPAGRGFVFSLSPIDDPDRVGTVTVTTTATANTACPGTPPSYNFRNPCTYTFTPDQALQDAATYVRCDLIDFDLFEPVTGLNPSPSRLGGTAYWDGTTVRPTANDGVGEMYYDGPPASWSYRVGNTGGGNSCSSLSFAAVSLRPEGCCAPCGGSGGGDGSGRTVQEVCVIATAAPDEVMTWTRVIEDGGATIYYLDQDGARYDGTLPAGHQIVVCPVEPEEPCRNTSVLPLCDTVPAGPVDLAARLTFTDVEPMEWIIPGGGVLHQPALVSGQPFWDGGTVTIAPPPEGEAGEPTHRVIAAQIGVQGAEELCNPPADVELTLTSVITNLGPNPGQATCGRWHLHNGTTIVVSQAATSTPVGATGNFSITGTVPYADLLAGNVHIALDVETAHFGVKSWTADQFAVTVTPATVDQCDTGGGEVTPFLRTVVTDCATGAVIDVSDTDYDGQAYTPAGEVGPCGSTSGTDTSGCQHCETLTLCDVQPDESPGEPEIAYEAIPLAELGPAGSYGDGSPVTGTLPNGVGYSVDVGEWGAGQGHYTFYPYDGTQTWTFDQPVYLRFGLRGLNISPTECYVLPEGAVPESINPNHTWDPAGRYLCEITGQSSATDESVFLLGPVTELPIVPSGSSTGGRGPGLIQVGVPVDAPEPGTATPFLRTLCRDCDGAVISATDTTLDGEPYTPTGDVTTCAAGTGTDPTPAEPEPRVDVETDALCLVDTDGVVLGRVLVERVYDAQSGERTEQRVVDLATGEPVEVPDGAELAACPDDLVPAVNVVQLCDMTDDADPVPFLRHLVHTLGHTAPDITDTTLDGVTPYTLTGTAGVCAEPCPVQAVLEECRWDDTDGDGVGDTAYVELLAVNCEGELTSIGTYADGLTGPYTPVSPVADGPVEPAAPVVLVEPHRIELAAGSTWDAATVTLLQSVTATAHGGTGGVVTSDGTSTLFDGESVTWSVARDDDAALTGPLTISAGTGTVTVAYTRATS
ncbi:hypothetical protein [Streptomyces sp. BSE6.1]|uniref:hypothetical protein n=1 Tax=Streptomyces sp. BSE6.1 TaxID=2605730 RepID=UPI001F1E6D60|nr:hypothetical protein [Streptomyces sp. BSE6.1]